MNQYKAQVKQKCTIYSDSQDTSPDCERILVHNP